MLTIKHIDEEGQETLTVAVSVKFDHRTGELIGYGAGDRVYAPGHVYVMNEQGKTVSVYNIKKEQS